MRLTLLHFNDLHGRLDRLPRMFTHIERIRRASERSLLVNTGDTCDRASMECDLTQGRAALAVLDAMGVDAGVPGNHDADWGPAAFVRWVASAHFPLLAANLAAPGLRSTALLETGGLRVGMTGVVTEMVAGLGLGWRDPLAATADAVAALRAEGAQVVVVLSHLGFAWAPEHDWMAPGAVTDVVLAEQVSGIDLIIGSHTHTPLAAPVRRGATWIAQAAPFGEALGRLALHLEAGALVDVQGELYPVDATTPIDPTVSSVVELVQESVDALRGRS